MEEHLKLELVQGWGGIEYGIKFSRLPNLPQGRGLRIGPFESLDEAEEFLTRFGWEKITSTDYIFRGKDQTEPQCATVISLDRVWPPVPETILIIMKS
ncbi:MAG: hypothetical protein WC095_01575 [Candidatus Paceibacterota bacterium]